MIDFDKIKMSVDYKAMSPKVIGALCQELHPEAVNEIEAVDIRINYLNKLIRLKISANIEAADDIIAFFVLCSAKRDLLKSTTIQDLFNPVIQSNYQSGGYIDDINRIRD